MKAQGREHAEWGFKKPADGWHIVEMGEGVALLAYKEDKDGHKAGATVVDAKGCKLWKFPAKINDADAEDNGADISQIIAENAFGEQKIADILVAIGKGKKFEEAFPGDHSFFESAIMDKIKISIPGQVCKMKTSTSKDGYINVQEIATIAFKPEEKKGGKKDAPKEGPKSAKTEAAGADASGW